MRSRSSAVLVVVLALAVSWLIGPSPAGAAVHTTTLECPDEPGVCTASTTPPAAGDNIVDVDGFKSATTQLFTVEESGNAEVTGITAHFSDGSTDELEVGEPVYSFDIDDGPYVETLVVTWNDNVAPTTSSPSTSSTTPSSTSSTSSTSTTTSTTTTTVPVTRGPGLGPASIRPDKVAKSSPDVAAVRGTERLDVVVSDGTAVWWSAENYPTPWTSYVNLGAPSTGIKGNPAIVSWAPGRLDIFVRGGNDKLYQKLSENGGQSWSDWILLFDGDGTLRASPEVASRGPNRLNLFVVNVDGDVYERFYDGPDVGWSGGWVYHGRPEGGIASAGDGGERADPGTVAWGSSERWDLFVRGADNRLHQRVWDGSVTSGWTKPVGDAGTLASEPEAASWEPGNLLIFARFSDNRAYALPFGTGGWGEWVALVRSTDEWVSGPGATSRGLNRFDLFVRGTDDLTYHIWQ